MSEHRYRVVAERSGDWWAISVPDLPGVFSQARRLDQVDAMAREAIALMLDVDETAVAVTIDPTLPPRTAAAVSEALSRRQARRDAEAREQEALRQAAGALAADGFTQRE
ncbi:MAG TPA: type II toxin-antitoxin system HicB family antitoxin, partial [Actinomycetota bacterium]